MFTPSVLNYNYNAVCCNHSPNNIYNMMTTSILDIKRSYVNIEGVNKDALLYALWFHAKPQNCLAVPEDYDIDKAHKQLIFGYADMICGRIIKCDIYANDEVDKSNYDHHNGDRMFVYIVNSLKYSV